MFAFSFYDFLFYGGGGGGGGGSPDITGVVYLSFNIKLLVVLVHFYMRIH